MRAVSADMTTTIRVATVNILNDLSHWDERRVLLVEGLRAQSPDLIGLQEVRRPLGVSNAHWLADELGGYSVHIAPKTGWSRRYEGIAVLSRLPVERSEILDLGSQQRSAQVVRVRVAGRPVVLINGHYYWHALHWHRLVHGARILQVARVLDAVQALDPGTSVVACGDFNASPGSPAIALLTRTLISAHAAHHGREPDYTCPTPLVTRGPVRAIFARAMLRLFTNRPGQSYRDTLDYIFVSRGVRVIECGVFLDRPSPDDPTLYASDHLGLAATLEIPHPEGSC
jgi:endonuclease/exonuclease/phosphatase family metal-dependent hydrolase